MAEVWFKSFDCTFLWVVFILQLLHSCCSLPNIFPLRFAILRIKVNPRRYIRPKSIDLSVQNPSKRKFSCSVCLCPVQDLTHLFRVFAPKPSTKSYFWHFLFLLPLFHTFGCDSTVGLVGSHELPGPVSSKGSGITPILTFLILFLVFIVILSRMSYCIYIQNCTMYFNILRLLFQTKQ